MIAETLKIYAMSAPPADSEVAQGNSEPSQAPPREIMARRI